MGYFDLWELAKGISAIVKASLSGVALAALQMSKDNQKPCYSSS